MLPFLWKKSGNKEKRLMNILSFKRGDVFFTVPAEKDGSLNTKNIVLVLHGYMQGLALKLREHNISLLSAGMRESVINPGNICVILVVDVYTSSGNNVKVGDTALRVELSKRLDQYMYVFTIENIDVVHGYATPLHIFPEYGFVYVDRDFLDSVKIGLHGEHDSK